MIPPESHLGTLRTFQTECTRYIFIGTAGWDTHVLQLIGENCPVAPLKIAIVNVGDDSAVNRISDGLRLGCPNTYDAPFATTVGSHGFTDWVHSSALDDFLTE